MKAEELAEVLHNTYEESSKIAGWNTQEKCQVPFNELPEKNKQVMLSMAYFVLGVVDEKERELEGKIMSLYALHVGTDVGDILKEHFGINEARDGRN